MDPFHPSQYPQGSLSAPGFHPEASSSATPFDFHHEMDDAEAMVNELYDPTVRMEVAEHAPSAFSAPHGDWIDHDFFYHQQNTYTPPLVACPMPLRDLIRDLKQYGLSQGYSTTTTRHWGTHLAKFEHWLHDNSPGLSLYPDPTDARLDDALERFKAEGKSREIRGCLSHLRDYFRNTQR